MEQTVYFESNRLLFLRPSEAELEEHAKWAKDPIVTKYVGGPKTDEQIMAFNTFLKEHWEKYQFGHYSIQLKTTREQVGIISLKFFTEEQESPDLGYLIYPPFQRKGYAHESIAAIIQFARNSLIFKEIQALNDPENLNSIKILKKHNFVLEGSNPLGYMGCEWNHLSRWKRKL